jgi:hypothetical protein
MGAMKKRLREESAKLQVEIMIEKSRNVDQVEARASAF